MNNVMRRALLGTVGHFNTFCSANLQSDTGDRSLPRLAHEDDAGRFEDLASALLAPAECLPKRREVAES